MMRITIKLYSELKFVNTDFHCYLMTLCTFIMSLKEAYEDINMNLHKHLGDPGLHFAINLIAQVQNQRNYT